MRLHYSGQPGEGFGWGVCNRYLILELSKLVELVGNESPDIVFQPLADHDFNPATPARGRINLAYTFFEFPLGPNAAANSAKYDLVFTGSTWCKERLAEIGVHNTEVLIQGVDHSIFRPDPLLERKKDDEFWLFSGGKFEYRKGQDLVLAAFKLLKDKYPKLRLVTAWQNPWPQLYKTMEQSQYIKFKVTTHDWPKLLRDTLLANDLPLDGRIVMLAGACKHEDMPRIMLQTDLGVFPNRCEGGTNLVMMEYMACGKPVCATYGTGHEDVLNPYISTFPHASLIECKVTAEHWCEATPDTVSQSIQSAMELHLDGHASRKAVFDFTWPRAAQQILDAIKTLESRRVA